MYVILGILYESYVHPVTVVSSDVPAVVGGLMTLWMLIDIVALQLSGSSCCWAS